MILKNVGSYPINAEKQPNSAPKIGGALYWVGLYLIFFMFICLDSIIGIYNLDFSNKLVAFSIFKVDFTLQLFLYVILLIVTVGYFKKYSYFPYMFIILLLGNLIYKAEYIFQEENWEYIFNIEFFIRFFNIYFINFLSLALDIILLIYIWKSKRVKQTFIR